MGVHPLHFYFINFYCFIICITQAFFPNLISSVSPVSLFPNMPLPSLQSQSSFLPIMLVWVILKHLTRSLSWKKALCIRYTYYYNMSFFKIILYVEQRLFGVFGITFQQININEIIWQINLLWGHLEIWFCLQMEISVVGIL